jgi:hypothetical protein
MHNVWSDLPQASPYVLAMDCASVNNYNAKAVGRKKINVESIPEPFIGNPETATVILLNLNPGDSPDDAKAHGDPEFRAAMILNLRHELHESPFYGLNQEFTWTPCANWWTKNLHELWDKGRLTRARVAERLCVIEWFPYHSSRSGLPKKPVCPSQEYSFELARRALGRKLVVGMRAKERWTMVNPRFAEIPYLKNPQCACVSVGNMPEGLFDEFVKALR